MGVVKRHLLKERGVSDNYFIRSDVDPIPPFQGSNVYFLGFTMALWDSLDNLKYAKSVTAILSNSCTIAFNAEDKVNVFYHSHPFDCIAVHDVYDPLSDLPYGIQALIGEREEITAEASAAMEYFMVLPNSPKDVPFYHKIGITALGMRKLNLLSTLRNAYPHKFGVSVVPHVNCMVNTQRVLGVLSKQQPFAVAYYDRGDHRLFTLVSSGNCGLDVSYIAKQMGGVSNLGVGYVKADLVLGA